MSRRWLSSIVLLLLLAGCSVLKVGKPPGPWHEAYRAIDDPESLAFVESAFAEARSRFGEPAVPVNNIVLRRSRKSEPARGYWIGEDFSLTECADPETGLFVIYIGVDPDHSNYHALLAHECLHLLNPRLTDWYVEGMATLFSEEVCAKLDKPWGDWKEYFEESRRDPYALSYRMMRELQTAFPNEYPSLLRHVREHGPDAAWMQIDIDRWMETLPAAERSKAAGIILPHASVLRRHTGRIYGFSEPTLK